CRCYSTTHLYHLDLHSVPTRRSSDLFISDDEDNSKADDESDNEADESDKDETDDNKAEETDKDETDDNKAEETDKDESDNEADEDRKSTRLNSSHVSISYAVFCLKKK